MTGAIGAVASSLSGPEWLTGSLWTLVVVGVVASLALHFKTNGAAETPSVEAEQEGSDNAQAVGGRDAVAQSGSGNLAVQGDHNTLYLPETHTEDDGRIYCNLSPEELTKFFDDQPTDDAERAVAKWLGTYLRVEGPFYDRVPFGDDALAVTFDLDTHGATVVNMIFAKEKERKRVTLLQRHEWIRAIGKIRDVRYKSVWLEDCELEQPQAASNPGSPSL